MLLCLTLSSSFGQDKDKKAEDKNAKSDPKEKWIPAGQVVAVLKEVRESDKSVVLSIQTQNRRRLLIARRPGGTFAHLDDGGGFSLPRAV